MMDGKNRLKHVKRLTGINRLRKVVSCWLYSENILAMPGHMNVKFKSTKLIVALSVFQLFSNDRIFEL
jgi:hypothetical protein